MVVVVVAGRDGLFRLACVRNEVHQPNIDIWM